MTAYEIARRTVAVVLRLVWRIRVVGIENVPLAGPLIVVANHVSNLDPPALGCLLPRPLYYMAKEELFAIPVLGRVIRAVNAFPVDRSRGDVAAIRRAVDVLRKGHALAMFPEGGRNVDGTKQPQNGAVLLSRLSGAAILPAYIAGSSAANRLARITVIYGKPFRLGEFEAQAADAGKKARRADLSKQTDEVMKRIFTLRETLGC